MSGLTRRRALRARWALTTAALLAAVGFAGCTNPDLDYDPGGSACVGTDTTAPVAGDECPTGEEGTGSPEGGNASAGASADAGQS